MVMLMIASMVVMPTSVHHGDVDANDMAGNSGGADGVGYINILYLIVFFIIV